MYIVFQAPNEIYFSHVKIFDVLWDNAEHIKSEDAKEYGEEM
jgi:hypothetical protein